MQAFITKGCMTDHGGIIQQGEDSWQVEGKGAHLEGMTHYCPRCKVMSKAIGSERGFIQVNGKNIIVAGDTSTCGAKFLKNQDLAVRDRGVGSGVKSNQIVDKILNKEQFFDEQVSAQFNFSEGMPYFIETDSGKNYQGTVGSDGKLPRIETETEGAYLLYLGEEAIIKGDNNDG